MMKKLSILAAIHLLALLAQASLWAAVGSQDSGFYKGSTTIANDISVCGYDPSHKPTALDGMNLQQIWDFRIKRVSLHKNLQIYPDDYNPFEASRAAIYKSIVAGKDWVATTPYYIANPYHLLNLAPANYVNPLNFLCPGVSIVCSGRKIEEKRKGRDSAQFFATVYDKGYDKAGKVRIMTVNACDAGFHYASVDPEKSENIAPEPETKNIMGNVYRCLGFYHVGRYQKNNLSPEDKNAWLMLKKKDVLTRITVKLWRKQPAFVKDDPDLVYVFSIEP